MWLTLTSPTSFVLYKILFLSLSISCLAFKTSPTLLTAGFRPFPLPIKSHHLFLGLAQPQQKNIIREVRVPIFSCSANIFRILDRRQRAIILPEGLSQKSKILYSTSFFDGYSRWILSSKWHGVCSWTPPSFSMYSAFNAASGYSIIIRQITRKAFYYS